MRLSITQSVINGLSIYSTYVARQGVKPPCNIPMLLVTKPEVFKDERLCTDCTCKYSCRYKGPDGGTPVPVRVTLRVKEKIQEERYDY